MEKTITENKWIALINAIRLRKKKYGSPVEIVVFAFLLLMEQGLYRLVSQILQDYLFLRRTLVEAALFF